MEYNLAFYFTDFVRSKLLTKQFFYYPASILLNPCLAEPVYTLAFANSVDPDQLASGSALFAIKYENL